MKCPKDQFELQKRIYEANIEIDECNKCGGMWLDAGELEQIQETIENDYSDQLDNLPDTVVTAYKMVKDKNQAKIACPKCDKEMIRKEYGFSSQIMIDICPTCRGIWLDKDELQVLEMFFEKNCAEANKEFTPLHAFFFRLTSLFK